MATSATDSRRVTVVFGADTSEAEAGFKKVANDAGAAGEETAGVGEKIKQKFGEVFKDALPSFIGSFLGSGGLESVTEGFKTLIESGGKLQESISKNELIFKSSGEGIVLWSKTASSAMQMSQQSALDGAAAFGEVFTAMGVSEQAAAGMSKQLVQVSAAFAALNGAKPADVMQALQSATRGEYDALQRYVPSISAASIQAEAMSETHKRAAKSLTDAEKATALYNLVIKASGPAQEEFGKSTETLAGQQRIMAATMEDARTKFGTAIEPMARGALNLVNAVGPLKSIGLAVAVIWGRQITAALSLANVAFQSVVLGVREEAAATWAATAGNNALSRSLNLVAASGRAAATGVVNLGAGKGIAAVTKLGIGLAAVNIAAASMGTSAAPNVERLSSSLDRLAKTGETSGAATATLGKNFDKFKSDIGYFDSSVSGRIQEGIAGTIESLTGLGGVMDNSMQHAKERISGVDQSLAQLVSSGHGAEAAADFEKLRAAARANDITFKDLKAALPGYATAVAEAAAAAKEHAEEVAKAGGEMALQYTKLQPVLRGTSSDVKDYSDALASVGKSGEGSKQQLTEYEGIARGVARSNLDASDKTKVFNEDLANVANIAGVSSDKLLGYVDIARSAGTAALGSSDTTKVLIGSLAGIDNMAVSAKEKLAGFSAIMTNAGGDALTSGDKAKVFSAALADIDATAGAGKPHVDALSSAFNQFSNATLNAKDKASLLKATMDDLYGARMSQNDALDNMTRSQIAFDDQMLQSSAGFDLHTAKTDKNKLAILDNRAALESALKAARDKYIADIAAGEGADDARKSFDNTTTALFKQIPKAQQNSAAVKDLVDKYGTIPKSKNTNVTVNDTAALIELLKTASWQRAISQNWSMTEANSYYNGLYSRYVTGNSAYSNTAAGADTVSSQNTNVKLRAMGGLIDGFSPHKRADNIPAMLTAKEYVHPVDAVEYYGVDTMDALRQRKIPADALKALSHYADGGLVWGGDWPVKVPLNVKMVHTPAELAKQYDAQQAMASVGGGGVPWNGTIQPGIIGKMQQWALAQRGKRYLWAAVGPNNYDCSGLVGDLWAMATGNPLYRRYMTTNDMGAGRHGMVSGPGKFTIYLSRSGGHTAANIGGLHAEAYHGNGTPLAIGHIGTRLSYYQERLHLPGLADGGLVPSDRDERLMSFLQNGWPEPPSDIQVPSRFRPLNDATYDSGGVLPPGDTLARNHTGKNEYVFTGDQLANAGGVTVNVTVQGNVTSEKDLAASIAKSVRDELLRIANRNGGRNGL